MLEPVVDNIWHVTEPMRMAPGVYLPIRMTVVRTGSGNVLLHSPVSLKQEWAEAVGALGKVRWVVAPNLYHHVHLKPTLQRFPDAQLLAAPGLAKKRPGLSVAAELSGRLPPELSDFEEVQVVGAPKMNESVFLHRPSGSVIIGDLVFNVTDVPTLATGLMLRVAGTRGGFAKSRLWNFLVKDKAAFAESLERICAWPAQRIIMGHGDIVEQDAGARLSAALG